MCKSKKPRITLGCLGVALRSSKSAGSWPCLSLPACPPYHLPSPLWKRLPPALSSPSHNLLTHALAKFSCCKLAPFHVPQQHREASTSALADFSLEWYKSASWHVCDTLWSAQATCTSQTSTLDCTFSQMWHLKHTFFTLGLQCLPHVTWVLHGNF